MEADILKTLFNSFTKMVALKKEKSRISFALEITVEFNFFLISASAYEPYYESYFIVLECSSSLISLLEPLLQIDEFTLDK